MHFLLQNKSVHSYYLAGHMLRPLGPRQEKTTATTLQDDFNAQTVISLKSSKKTIAQQFLTSKHQFSWILNMKQLSGTTKIFFPFLIQKTSAHCTLKVSDINEKESCFFPTIFSCLAFKTIDVRNYTTPIPRIAHILVPGKNHIKQNPHQWDCINVSTNAKFPHQHVHRPKSA